MNSVSTLLDFSLQEMATPAGYCVLVETSWPARCCWRNSLLFRITRESPPRTLFFISHPTASIQFVHQKKKSLVFQKRKVRDPFVFSTAISYKRKIRWNANGYNTYRHRCLLFGWFDREGKNRDQNVEYNWNRGLGCDVTFDGSSRLSSLDPNYPWLNVNEESPTSLAWTIKKRWKAYLQIAIVDNLTEWKILLFHSLGVRREINTISRWEFDGNSTPATNKLTKLIKHSTAS